MGIGQCDLGNPSGEAPSSQVTLGFVTLAVKTEQQSPCKLKEGGEESHQTSLSQLTHKCGRGGQSLVTSSVITSIVEMTSVWGLESRCLALASLFCLSVLSVPICPHPCSHIFCDYLWF